MPAPVRTQSPQFLRPSDAVHGRSNANRKTLRVAIRTAEPQTSHGRANSAPYIGANELDLIIEGLASAEAPLRLARPRQSRARSAARIRRGAHDGIAEPLPRRHAARDVEPAL